MAKTQVIIGGLDNGNGYIKAALRGAADAEADRFDIPSGVAVVTRPADIPQPDVAAKEAVNDSFFDNLDLSFETPSVSSTHRHIFGTRGLRANAPRYREFDILRDISKAEQDLSMIFIIGLFAAKGVKDYVNTHGELPQDILRVDAKVALALPIDEYRDHRVAFAAKLQGANHRVLLRNFETTVVVEVSFSKVAVTAEGSAAQFAIVELGEKFTQAMLNDLVKQGYELPAGVTAKDVHSAKNTIGIDIGEGTVNFPVYTDGSFNTDASRTFAEGYGTVLLRAMPLLEAAGLKQRSRKKLADYLLEAPSALKREQWETTKAIVDEVAEEWCEQLIQEFSAVFEDVRYVAEVGYVFGGGSGPLKEILYPKLLARVEKAFPVLYLDARYSRHLNRQGLLIAAEKIAKSK